MQQDNAQLSTEGTLNFNLTNICISFILCDVDRIYYPAKLDV